MGDTFHVNVIGGDLIKILIYNSDQDDKEPANPDEIPSNEDEKPAPPLPDNDNFFADTKPRGRPKGT